MNSRFIACGGTGAHVMLAMVRLHILGYPFGFFFKDGNKFPDLFLVDQDSGDGKNKSTPWQEVKHLIKIHPGRYNLPKYLGRQDLPICKDVSPLPVGKDKNWYKPPYHQLKYRFRDSPILPLVTSEAQREITYDLGMMASPAVGSLLFSLKELDCEEENKGNYDVAYNEMLQDSKASRIVVCGSSVGGTGSSVAPTLARLCKDKGADVMAVMIHSWFMFTRPEESREIFDKSFERNKRMKENAAGGLACYGHELSRSVPTVLVGIPEHRWTQRDYTSDNQQPYQDSYAHAVGAFAGIKYFLAGKESEDEIKEGLYGVSASDSSKLTGDIIAGDSDEASLFTMVGHAQFLTYLLKVFSKLLRVNSKTNSSSRQSSFSNFFIFAGQTPFSSIAYWAYKQIGHDYSRLEDAANELDKLVNNYEKLLNWINSPDPETPSNFSINEDDVKEKSDQFFLPELKCIERLKNNPLPKKLVGLQNSPSANLSQVETVVALALFHWVADWIKDDWNSVKLNPTSEETKEGEGYWPDTSTHDDGIPPTWEKPGELGKVSDGKAITTIGNYFDSRNVSPNSWPHPFAIVEQYRFQITNKNPAALHKLELLLIGRALGILEFKKVDTKNNVGSLSLERLLKNEEIAKYRLIHTESEKIYGFNSPDTLLCPVPDVSDKDWRTLRKNIISGTTVRESRNEVTNMDQEEINWENSIKDWGKRGEEARKCIKGWLKCIERCVKLTVSEDSRTWVDIFDEHFDSETGPFGIAEWLPVPSQEVRIPIPILEPSINLFEESEPNKQEAEKKVQDFIKIIPEVKEITVTKLGKSETFQLIEDFRLPGLDYPIRAIWREHLEALQESTKIFAWQKDQTESGIWIRENLEDSPIYLRDLLVIDVDEIQITTCIPLEQKSVSGSTDKRLKYPDIPLRPDFIDLLKVPKGEEHEGEKCLNHDKAWSALGGSGKENRARKLVRWKLDLMGRSEPVRIVVPLDKIEPAKAHWMIWPNFKSPSNPDAPDQLWRTYYIYEQSDRESLEARTIYRDKRGHLSAIKKAPSGCPGNSYALDFNDGLHVGGPPVALSGYDQKHRKDTGIYVVCLHEYPRDKEPWKLAIDFGTSHTVAAYEINTEKESVNLDAELTSDNGLSLHISENYDVQDVSRMGLDIWRPTYNETGSNEIAKALLPSDLWCVEKRPIRYGRFKSEWSPMTHYSIPVMHLQRSNLLDHIISGFKWDLKEGEFRGEEQWLRERYLRMAMEIFVADIVRKTKNLPTQIETTFTYPLRGTITQATEKFKDVIDEVLKASKQDLGIEFSLYQGHGLYSESHAAYDSVGDGVPINVKLVADLGGGTLDMLISTYDVPSKHRENRFQEVEDSVKIGSDILLRELAGNTAIYLPKGEDRGWESEPDKAYEQLRAWMRSVGSEKLFGVDSENWNAPHLKLKGFGKPEEGNNARDLISRYFGIIIDFLARYLVAYVVADVLPQLKSDSDRKRLNLLVNLRGNGWRLWHGNRDYADIQQTMESLVEDRANQLWIHAGIADSLPDKVWKKADLIHQNSPKLGPIKMAIGQSMDPEKARKRSHRFPLSDILILDREQEDKRKHWHEKLPFKGVSETDSLHVDEFNPPLVMHAHSDEGLRKIEDPLMKEINDNISGNQSIRDSLQNTVDAPIAVQIWENLFKSDKFTGR